MVRLVIVTALMFVVVALVGCSSEGDEMVTATDLVDAWVAGWNAKDPEQVAAVFTDDAQYMNPTGTETFTGRDEIRTHATEYREFIMNARRVGDGVATEDEGFVFRIEFDAETKSYPGEIEVELRDDLLARMVWLTYEQLN